jgi:phage terminase large subunit-like protein
VYSGKIKHDGNPALSWMLASCVIYADANDNMKVHKGRSGANGRRVDGIIATINAWWFYVNTRRNKRKYLQPGRY